MYHKCVVYFSTNKFIGDDVKMFKLTIPNENKTLELAHSLDVYNLIQARQKELKKLSNSEWKNAYESLNYIKNIAKQYHLGLELKVDYKSFQGVDTTVVRFPKTVTLDQIQKVLELSGYSQDNNNIITNSDNVATYCHTHVFIQCNDSNKKLVINSYLNL